MNNMVEVAGMIRGWKEAGKTKSEIVILTAKATMGWPYVWGAIGDEDTVERREYYMNRSAIGESDKELIRKRCQQLNGSADSCTGCTYFPGGFHTRMFDCRGFTRWLLAQVGISLQGAGATSQWNDNSNWSEKGEISALPPGNVACVFKHIASTGKMDHTGMHIGNGVIIHCSGEVRTGKTTDKGWTHYAIPKGMDGDVPVWRPTIRRGSTGDDVKYCQEILIGLGYNLGSYGADGKFGAKTEAAVRAFQKANGLGVDGIVGPMTWEKLENVSPQPTTLYTVTVPHLTEAQADALTATYPGASKKAEGE